MPTLSVCLIVKNEEEVLARCLSSLRGIAEEIIIVDTGSTDNTVTIAKMFTPDVHFFKWINDFAAARNFSFSKATCDYMMWLDADDVLSEEATKKIKELRKGFSADIIGCMYDYAQDAQGESTCLMWRERIIKNNGKGYWKYPVHEVFIADNTASHETIPVTITHKKTHSGAAADSGRNLGILSRAVKLPEWKSDPRILYYLAREYKDTGQISPATKYFEQLIALEHVWWEDRFNATWQLAECYFRLSEGRQKQDLFLKKAEAAALKAICITANCSEPYFMLGLIAMKKEEYEKAEQLFLSCLRPRPEMQSPVSQFYYEDGPLLQLLFCYDKQKKYKFALLCNERRWITEKTDASYLHNRSYFESVAGPMFQPVVDIIIPTRNNPAYLEATLASIYACSPAVYRIIIIDSSDEQYNYEKDEHTFFFRTGKPLHYAAAVNKGLLLSSAPFVILLNDDVIVSKGWLEPLLESCGKGPGMLHPLSNNNTGWLHHYHLICKDVELASRSFQMEGDLFVHRLDPGQRGIVTDLYDCSSSSTHIFPTQWVPFFCVAASRETWQKGGLLIEQYYNGYEDVDYCFKLATMNIPVIVDERSFVFHFGSVSLHKDEQSAASEDKNKLLFLSRFPNAL